MEIDRWSDFLKAIDKATYDLGCKNSGAWFRGVTSHKHRLYPSLLRPKSKITYKHERDIYERADDFDSLSIDSIGSWEKLVKLQHYGAPTRLLDWTENVGVALYFALNGLAGEIPECPAIWVLNPFKLARLARKSNDKRIGVFHKDSNTDYFERFVGGQTIDWPFSAPMPYRPPKLTPRIRAQRGFFTVHGTDLRPVDAIFSDCVRQVRIHKDASLKGREYLRIFGIDSVLLFPDYDGFNRMLRDRYE